MIEFTIAGVQREISQRGQQWEAGATSLADLPPEDQDRRLGLRPDASEMDRLRHAFETLICEPCEFPPTWDWRAVDGQDWTTEVRDQGACGSCVAFAVLGAVEIMAKWKGANPARDVDLSEGHLFFCGCGPCCESGWWPGDALDYLVELGVPDEDCLPYQDTNLSCRDTCTNWAARAVRVGGWHEILEANARKQWLSHIGPLVGAMAVYRDFFYYTGGVYRPVSTDLAGYHAVTVVGYDNSQAAWLCKNSWGIGWGEGGWFRLGYNECGLDTEFPAWGIESLISPEEPPTSPQPSGCSPLGRMLKVVKRGNQGETAVRGPLMSRQQTAGPRPARPSRLAFRPLRANSRTRKMTVSEYCQRLLDRSFEPVGSDTGASGRGILAFAPCALGNTSWN